MFDETETSKVTRMIKDMDPSFNMEGFLRELREYIVPEVVDAFVNADQATLKKWCSEAVRFFPLTFLVARSQICSYEVYSLWWLHRRLTS